MPTKRVIAISLHFKEGLDFKTACLVAGIDPQELSPYSSKEKFLAEYSDSKSVLTLSERLGVNYRECREAVLLAGAPLTKKGAYRKKLPSREVLEAHISEGLSMVGIAKLYGVSRQAVFAALKR